MKKCCRCKEEHDNNMFYKNASQKDGLSRQCKPCQKLTSSKYQQSSKGKAVQAKYERSDKGKVFAQKLRSSNIGKAIKQRYRQSDKGKLCGRKSARRRDAQKLHAIPKWCEDDKIALLHKKAIELSNKWSIQLDVDHIIPLVNDKVCGLHCWDNLQLLEHRDNMLKNNKYETSW